MRQRLQSEWEGDAIVQVQAAIVSRLEREARAQTSRPRREQRSVPPLGRASFGGAGLVAGSADGRSMLSRADEYAAFLHDAVAAGFTTVPSRVGDAIPGFAALVSRTGLNARPDLPPGPEQLELAMHAGDGPSGASSSELAAMLALHRCGEAELQGALARLCDAPGGAALWRGFVMGRLPQQLTRMLAMHNEGASPPQPPIPSALDAARGARRELALLMASLLRTERLPA
eukprot:201196-Prymnesium_polylepis.1